ncbi:MAG: HEPN domain-containing protein [Candidatus Micrarchaeota archaeon]
MASFETVEWLKKAKRDLKAAKLNQENGLFEEAAFFAHQAAEKSLKAAYISEFKRLRKIHDLVELGRELLAPMKIIVECDGLNPHYIAARYPMDVEYDELTSLKAIASAIKVVEWAEEKFLNSGK